MHRSFLLLGCALASVNAYVDWDVVRAVNTAGKWEAGYNANWQAFDLNRIRGLMGSKHTIKTDVVVTDKGVSAPASFDSRTAWPKCSSISFIRNQAECGSCWAFGAVEAFTDRYCVSANGMVNPSMSAQKLVTCDQSSDGCNGGFAMSAWNFIKNTGLPVTACQPYTLPTCPPIKQPCMPPFQPTPQCKSGCYGSSTNSTAFHVSRVYMPGFGADQRSLSIANVQTDMVAHGPVEACFSVYEDFIHYKSGVYKHTSGQLLGGHCVKIIGWGELNGEDYWQVSNSWTTTWGDKGYFKILRGVNECGIESDIVAGTPMV